MTDLLPNQRTLARQRARARAKTWFTAFVALVIAFGIWLALVVLLGGCCTTGLIQKCCPKPAPPLTVEIAKPCAMPPVPVLPDVLPASSDCPLPYVCFDPVNAKLLAERHRLLRTWIRETVATCGAPTSRPR